MEDVSERREIPGAAALRRMSFLPAAQRARCLSTDGSKWGSAIRAATCKRKCSAHLKHLAISSARLDTLNCLYNARTYTCTVLWLMPRTLATSFSLFPSNSRAKVSRWRGVAVGAWNVADAGTAITATAPTTLRHLAHKTPAPALWE
jgi:hypothetical protein